MSAVTIARCNAFYAVGLGNCRAIIRRCSTPPTRPIRISVYFNYLETCRRLGIDPVSRERAIGLIREWGEALTGRPEPTTH